MRSLNAVKLLLLLLVVATVATGCRGCLRNSFLDRLNGRETAEPMAPGQGVESSVLPEPIRGETAHEIPDLKRIFFGFDSAGVLEGAKKDLDANAAWMKANPGVHIQIEGHCDERGTADYNYALGERRADAARNYLVNSGVQPERLHTISYGSERSADDTHSEMAWARNRRAQFLVYGGGR